MIKDLQWARILTEGAVIVVSILLAFWIDAWWGNQQEAEQEQVLLASLLADLQSVREIRRGRDDAADEIMDSARRLLEIGRSADDPATPAEIDSLLSDLTYMAGAFSQGSSVLEMLFSGGQLARISDNELRTALADLRFGLIEDAKGSRRELAFLEDQFYPYLVSKGSFAHIWAADEGQPANDVADYNYADFPYGSEIATVTEFSHRELLADREFQNLLMQKILTVQAVKGWEDNVYDVDASLEKCIALIEASLAD